MFVRRLCLICFCSLVAAPAIGVLDIVMVLNNATSFASCRWRPEIFPLFSCTGSLLEQFVGFLLNLPLFLFIYAPIFTLFRPPLLFSSWMMPMLYAFDIVLVLGISYPVLRIVEWWRSGAKG